MICKESVDAVFSKLEAACKAASRNISEVEFMAVSKFQSSEAVLKAIDLNLKTFGENWVAEARDKFSLIKLNHNALSLHLIGHLQTNKVKNSVGFFDYIDSVDSVKLAKKISSVAAELGVVQKIYLEQNCSGEESKSGFATTSELFSAACEIRQLPNIIIEGLMTMAPNCDSEVAIRKSFAMLRENFFTLKEKEGLESLKTLSMGMSGDFNYAIAEGSNLVRIGTALFGERQYG